MVLHPPAETAPSWVDTNCLPFLLWGLARTPTRHLNDARWTGAHRHAPLRHAPLRLWAVRPVERLAVASLALLFAFAFRRFPKTTKCWKDAAASPVLYSRATCRTDLIS